MLYLRPVSGNSRLKHCLLFDGSKLAYMSAASRWQLDLRETVFICWLFACNYKNYRRTQGFNDKEAGKQFI